MKQFPFSLLVDGSNDTGLENLNPLTVKIFDVKRSQVVYNISVRHVYYTGHECGTASAIFSKIDFILDKHNIPWRNCVGFGVDNTIVNVGKHHSIMTHVHEKTVLVISWGMLATLYTTLLVKPLSLCKK